MSAHLMPGPVMLDLEGRSLTVRDRRRLLHPLTGGVILFTRNYESPEQIAALTSEIRALRDPPLLITVDHEGGRVQRFRTGFTRLPPMRMLGEIWDTDPVRARRLASDAGYVLAAELLACGVDLSFTPVLDLDYRKSEVIGDRALHSQPPGICDLAAALLDGLAEAGMSACGKHFPGHGYVAADSHVDVPVDHRGFAELAAADLVPFRNMIQHGLSSIMPAHVIYPSIDPHPAGFSAFWLGKVLRGDMGFQGLIFSDDLSMEGASVAGGILDRAYAALNAGCDVVLVCNRPDSADELLSGLDYRISEASLARLANLRGRPVATLSALRASERYALAVQSIMSIGQSSNSLLAQEKQVGERA
jgi:beta-N-acetylhexosaminidase